MTAQLAVMPSAVPSDADALDFAFPAIDPGVKPAGSRVLVQFRRPMMRTKAGILIPDVVRDEEKFQTQTAKIVGVGPLAFRNRVSGELWPEGAWCKVGDFVRITRHGGDRFVVPVKDSVEGDEIMFGVFDDTNIIAEITADPLSFKAYV